MALIRYGGGIVQMSGSIAGDVFARNRFGNYTRARTKPVNPNSTRQGIARSAVSLLAAWWAASLSPTERGQWETYAGGVSMKNKLGETIKLTGFNHFVRSNAYKAYVGYPIIEAGPSVLELPEKDPTMTVVINVSTQKMLISFDNALPWANETGAYMIIHQGKPQNATRNFFGGPFRQAGQIVGATGAPPTSPQDIACVFPAVLGQKIWVKARIIRADGRLSMPFYTNVLVTA